MDTIYKWVDQIGYILPPGIVNIIRFGALGLWLLLALYVSSYAWASGEEAAARLTQKKTDLPKVQEKLLRQRNLHRRPNVVLPDLEDLPEESYLFSGTIQNKSPENRQIIREDYSSDYNYDRGEERMDRLSEKRQLGTSSQSLEADDLSDEKTPNNLKYNEERERRYLSSRRPAYIGEGKHPEGSSSTHSYLPRGTSDQSMIGPKGGSSPLLSVDKGIERGVGTSVTGERKPQATPKNIILEKVLEFEKVGMPENKASVKDSLPLFPLPALPEN